MRTHHLPAICSALALAASLNACGGTMTTDDGATNTDAADHTTAHDTSATDTPAMDAANDTASSDTGVMDSATDEGPADTGPADTGPSDTGPADTGGGTMFPAGTICNDSGAARTPPTRYQHVIVFIMENKSFNAIHGAAAAPYFNSLAMQCGYSTRFMDNMFGSTDLVSLPHYLALTSGSNCNTGIGSNGGGCITDDRDATAHRLNTRSIFQQVGSWRAYQESMPSACSASSATPYFAKHNPPPYYSALTGCNANDIAIAHVNCPTNPDSRCGNPTNALTRDLANDTLPEFAFVTPDQQNDMHDGTVSQGDNFLHTYLPLVFASAAYRRGEVAVYVLWDESSPGTPQPNLIISPYTPPTMSTTTMNLFAVLRTIETQLGISTHLGCAGGTPPGGSGTCPNGSQADLRTAFHF